MGKYATTSTISLKLPDVLDGNTTTSDESFTNTFSRFIDKAEAKFDSVVSRKYSLPFSVVPPMAREICFCMATWYTIRAFSTRDWPNRNEMLDDYQSCFEDLQMIGKGDLKLNLTDGTLLEVRTDLLNSNRIGQGSIFDVDDPENWKVDQDRLDELDGSRG